VPKSKQVYLQCWHGTPLKKLGHDIVSNTDHAKYTQAELAEQYDDEAKRFTYLLSPSRYATKCFSSAFNLKSLGKEDRILELGYPRNDYLYDYKKADINRIKSKLNIPKNKKVLLYTPTWRDNQHDSATGYVYNNPLDLEYLQKQIGKDWVILFRAHYFISNKFNFSKYSGFVIDVTNIDDINELYIISDTMMTDYSSTIFDYSILKKPVILFMHDKEYYQNNIRGFYMDINSIPGFFVNSSLDIENFLNNFDEISYNNDKLNDFNAIYNPTTTRKTASKVIESIID